jgi:hypothetical protein
LLALITLHATRWNHIKSEANSLPLPEMFATPQATFCEAAFLPLLRTARFQDILEVVNALKSVAERATD